MRISDYRPKPYSPVVVGLDLSLTSTGLALIAEGAVFQVANIKTSGRKGAKPDAMQRRIASIRKQTVAFARVADLVVVEAPSFGSRFGAQHERAGLYWGVVMDLAESDIPLAFVPPKSRAKYATGNGNAKKDVVLAHVIERYTNANVRIKNDDIADAVVLAAMGARALLHPIEDNLDMDNLKAMAGAEWPEVSLAALLA